MKYLVGVDGGGTGSSCVITDPEGKVLFSCKGGPTNFLRYDIDEVCKTLYSLLNECKKSQKISFKDIGGVVIGTAGGGREKDAMFLEKQLIKYLRLKKAPMKFIKVIDDGIIALEGAFSGGPGCILISGTGSIIYGKNQKGKYFRLGGYGNRIGDEGSGYSIGRKGLNAVAKNFDGRAEKTMLTGYLRRHFKINNGQFLIDKIYSGNFDIASFAPFVIKVAGKKDKISINILNDEAEELLLHIKAMKKLLNNKFDIAFLGSLISGKNYYSDLLKKKINRELKGVKIVKPENSPEVGAVLLARQLIKNISALNNL